MPKVSNIFLLESVELFNALSEQQLVAISTAARREVYEMNDVVFNQGDPGNCFYIVERGEVSVGLRRVLVIQAVRLAYMSACRLAEIEGRAAPNPDAFEVRSLIGVELFDETL